MAAGVHASDSLIQDSQAEGGAYARLKTKEELHHFGLMQPGQVASYSFSLRNVGSSVLTIEGIKGSCRCLTYEVTPKAIPPGEEGQLKVTWRAKTKNGEVFRQLVRIKTNDPDKETVDFIISGEVGGHLQFAPTRVEWKNAQQNQEYTAKVRISTRFWPALHISNVESSVPGLRCQVLENPTPLDSKQREKAARQLVFTVPQELTSKSFEGLVTMTLAPFPEDGETPGIVVGHSSPSDREHRDSRMESPVDVQVPFSFEVASPLTVIGGGYDPEEQRAYLGIQKPGKEIRRRYLIKVRDPEKKLTLRSNRIIPSVVEVSFEEYNADRGLYRLQLRVPPDVLDRAYIGEEAGRLDLEFDHPRIRSKSMAIEISPSR